MKVSRLAAGRQRVVLTVGSLALVALTAGCGVGLARSVGNGASGPSGSTPVTTLTAGSSTQIISVRGAKRTFHVYVPAHMSGAAPLLVMLHGGFGSGTQAERAYHWDSEADTGHFVVAYPDGLSKAWNAGGGCCGRPAANNVDDVGFITQMITRIQGETTIDPARVYATGISNGGIMAYRLACDTKIFAAIGPDSATMLGSCPNPAPISVIHVHGSADKLVPYNGGKGEGIAHINGPAVPALIAGWRATDNCASPVASTSGEVTTSTADCPSGRTVQLVTIAEAGHQWPGGASRPVVQRLLHLDPPSTALNATDTIWRFFAAHHK
jgi:polyhydroxybutyrate depolymerase